MPPYYSPIVIRCPLYTPLSCYNILLYTFEEVAPIDFRCVKFGCSSLYLWKSQRQLLWKPHTPLHKAQNCKMLQEH